MTDSNSIRLYYGKREVKDIEGPGINLANIQIKAADLGAKKVKIYVDPMYVQIDYLDSVKSIGALDDVVYRDLIWMGSGDELQLTLKKLRKKGSFV